MRLAAGASALVSLLLTACTGSDHAPALADLEENPGLDGRTPGDSPGGGVGASGGMGAAGTSGTFIPTPVETEPGPTETEPQPMPPQGQGGSTATTPSGPCSRGEWTGDFSARSQSDLQGLSGYTRVTGNLYVGTGSNSFATDVTSLSALSCLEGVDGLFTILENPQLRDLHGLEELALVDDFTLSTNAGLETLEGLTSLVVVDTLFLRANAALHSLGAGILDAGTLIVSENPQLPQCRADALAAELGIPCSYCGDNSDAPCN